MVKSTKHPDQVVQELIRRVRGGEPPRSVAVDLGVKYNSALGWLKMDRVQRGEKRTAINVYTDEFRTSCVEYAKIHYERSITDLAHELNLNTKALKSWLVAAGLEYTRLYSKVLIDESVMRMRGGESVRAVAESTGVNEATIAHWSRQDRLARSIPLKKHNTWSDVDKEKAVQIASREGMNEAKAQTGISTQAIRQWLKEAGIVHKGSREGQKIYASDQTFGWITVDHPHLEEWRPLMARWIGESKSSLQTRMRSLRMFVLNYLHERIFQNNFPCLPAQVLSRSVQLPDFFQACIEGKYAKDNGRINNNYVNEFLEWVLLHELSDADDYGRPVVSPQFHNPVPKRERGGGGALAESVRSPLPYGYIDELRRILCAGPNFQDWVWAQTGGRALRLHATDWYEIDENLIDKTDPDCVWRLRETRVGRKTLEMWSPVRWVALLIKLILPLRTMQVRVLDSGEADTFRYGRDENGVPRWAVSESILAEGTIRSPLRQGALRRIVQTQDSKISVLLYINTNKTADIAKDGAAKGYELPWLTTAPIHSDPFYWLEKIRNWQEKYNPISRRVSWTELDSSRLDPKAAVQLASYPDACFLFRLPETGPAAAHLPPPLSVMDTPWLNLLRAYQERLAARGEVHADGSAIELVKPGVDWMLFPLHSLRVSLITALALEGKVPFPILQKIAGHSRLLMTLYYTKIGINHTHVELEDAAKRMDLKKGESIISFLKNTEYKSLVTTAISNNSLAFGLAIPEHPAVRNPAGWMQMHHGLCLVGGNTVAMDSNNSIGGCYNGGPNIGSDSTPRYAPTPGGARNCVRCRWFVTEPHYIWALTAHANTLFYHSDEAMKQSLKTERELSSKKAERADLEEQGRALSMQKQIELAETERLHETAMQRYSDLTEDVAATVRLVQRSLEQAKKIGTSGAPEGVLVAVGSKPDIQMLVEEVPSELLQLSGVCEAAELYPDLNPGKAIFRRSQLLDAALAREGLPPALMVLEEDEQLVVGNALMNKLARIANAANHVLGRRAVVSAMDAGRKLSDALSIDVGTLLHASNDAPCALLEGQYEV